MLNIEMGLYFIDIVLRKIIANVTKTEDGMFHNAEEAPNTSKVETP